MAEVLYAGDLFLSSAKPGFLGRDFFIAFIVNQFIRRHRWQMSAFSGAFRFRLLDEGAFVFRDLKMRTWI